MIFSVASSDIIIYGTSNKTKGTHYNPEGGFFVLKVGLCRLNGRYLNILYSSRGGNYAQKH
jgi:hypothetical protein